MALGHQPRVVSTLEVWRYQFLNTSAVLLSYPSKSLPELVKTSIETVSNHQGSWLVLNPSHPKKTIKRSLNMCPCWVNISKLHKVVKSTPLLKQAEPETRSDEADPRHSIGCKQICLQNVCWSLNVASMWRSTEPHHARDPSALGPSLVPCESRALSKAQHLEEALWQ